MLVRLTFDKDGGVGYEDVGGGGVGESPAIEVIKYREEKGKGMFATSAKPRNPKSPHVK
jgi:hypothetical protein